MKKFMSIILCFCLMFCSCIAVNAVEEESNPDILSENDVLEIKENYDLTSDLGKKEYLREVFNNIGVDEKYVNLLKGDLLDDFVNSEKYGSKVTELTKNERISLLSSGSNDKYDGDMYLLIIWSKSGDEYSILGACEWLELPIARFTDVISIDLGSGSVVNDSQVLAVQYTRGGELLETELNSDSSYYQGSRTACAFKFDVPYSIDSLVVAVGYSVRNLSDYNTIYLQYFHSYLPINISVGVSIGVLGVSITPSYGTTPYDLQCGTA